jgi:hypothetical protein
MILGAEMLSKLDRSKTKQKQNGYQLRRLYALLAATMCIAGSAGNATADEPTFDKPFDKPLFSDSLFSNTDIGSSLDSDVSTKVTKQAVNPGALVAQQINNSQVDMEFIRQLRSCTRWLQLYGIRNSSRFPGLTNDESYAAQVQLNELVPNNPYNPGYAQNSYQGTAAWMNSNGSPATGSPVWADQWTEHLQASNNARVILAMDYSITPDIINQYAQHPPETWTAAPGTITCVGNGQGLFLVWGAGRDGKPVKNPANGLTYISAGSTSGLINDQVAPNEGGIP